MPLRTLLGLTLLVVFAAVALARFGSEEPAVPAGADGFATLDEAVAFLAGAVERGDRAALTAACPAGADSVPDYVLTSLARTHAGTPLPELYAGREFPADTTAFKLGGHASELGYIHVDFFREGRRWYLKSVWMCR